MKYRIESNDRMFDVLANDSYKNPEKIRPVLEAEIREIAKEYLNLSGEVKLRYKFTDSGLVFVAEIPTESVKNIFIMWNISIN